MSARFAHVPKRATQHGFFVSSSETPPVDLKPGQQNLHGMQVFTQEARPYRETYLTQDQTRDSMYKTSVAQVTKPEDYVNPARPFTPPHGVTPAGGGTAHWQSEYKATSQKAPTPYSPPVKHRNVLHVTPRQGDESSHTQEFGRYGSDPRDLLLNREPGKLPVLKHVLNFGTTKGTQHIPGYQGYLPFHAATPQASRALEGAADRSVAKVNLSEIFHVNLVGYAGHTPESARNDRGGRKPTDLTTMDTDYVTPRKFGTPRR